MAGGEATWRTALTFDDTESFNTAFEDSETFETSMDSVVEVMTSDHRKLTHRDAENQHPITSINNLGGELEARPSSALTNSDIQSILNA